MAHPSEAWLSRYLGSPNADPVGRQNIGRFLANRPKDQIRSHIPCDQESEPDEADLRAPNGFHRLKYDRSALFLESGFPSMATLSLKFSMILQRTE